MTPQETEQIIKSAQALVDQNCESVAIQLLSTNKIKAIIRDGIVIDQDDECVIWLERFITVNKDMLQLKSDVIKLAPTNHDVLIVGPSGTGKEILARALHGKRKGEFISLNCAGMPETLIESELFGYVKNAFTGADRDTEGLIEAAEDGTLFLDEIGELPILAQAKLLRAIQSRRIRRVGGKSEFDFKCRIVCATNRDIKSMVEDKSFRLDLYARISTFELNTSSLSVRPEDIEPIIHNIDGGKDYWALAKQKPMKTPFNVRSLQQHVARWRVLGRV